MDHSNQCNITFSLFTRHCMHKKQLVINQHLTAEFTCVIKMCSSLHFKRYDRETSSVQHAQEHCTTSWCNVNKLVEHYIFFFIEIYKIIALIISIYYMAGTCGDFIKNYISSQSDSCK